MRPSRIVQSIVGMVLIAGMNACGSEAPSSSGQPAAAVTSAAPTASGSPSTATADARCSWTQGWGTVPKTSALTTTHKVVGVRVSADRQSVCFDQVLFVLDGKDKFAGFATTYLNDTTLRVTVRAPGSARIALPSAADFGPMKVVKKVSAASVTAAETVFTVQLTARLAFTTDVQLDGASGSAVVLKISLE